MNSYQSLSPQSKVWIYQSKRPFDTKEVAQLRQEIQQFTQQWVSHSRQLRAFGDVFYDRFIVLMVDESQAGASGCSIDTSVRFVKLIEQQYATELFDRMTFAYRKEEQIHLAERDEFAKLYATGAIDDNTLVFDNLVKDKKAFDEKWLIPLKDSWHKRMV